MGRKIAGGKNADLAPQIGGGGLNLLGIEAQYKALTGNLILWILRPEQHPLRSILKGHIADASRRRWGFGDLTWIVTHCGTMNMPSSAPWQNISRAWASMRKWLLPSQPANLSEWRDLPLWRPHLNHVDPSLAKCTTIAQQNLRDCGLQRMGDVLCPQALFITWNEARRLGAPISTERAFLDLVRNLHNRTSIRPQNERMDFFVDAGEGSDRQLVWQYQLPARQLHEAWLPFLDSSTAIRTFRSEGIKLHPVNCSALGPEVMLRRIMVGSPRHSNKHLHLGPWLEENILLTQYEWLDGTQLANSSTSQLRLLLTRQAARPHTALNKWSAQLNRPIPPDVWQSTWLKFRSATENTFMWQIFYRILATQTWRFPQKPASDPEIWCLRCSTGTPEDVLHCIWSCPASRRCWDWSAEVLSLASDLDHPAIVLRPEHVVMTAALPAAWEVPTRLWQTLCAVLCWNIWKDRNNHIFGNVRSSVQRTIRLSWHRLSIYLQMAWQMFRRRIHTGELTVEEARMRMAALYRREGRLWSLHEVSLQVLPVPPRPP